MSGAREQILTNIRRSLGRDAELSESVRAELVARIERRQRGPLPQVSGDLVKLFTQKLAAVSATYALVESAKQAVQEIANHLQKHQLAPEMVVSSEPLIQGLRWPEDWKVGYRVATGEDRVSVTGAFAAIAETGTLALLSGPSSPTTLRFLPDDHIVVIESQQIVAHVEDVWDLMREEYDGPPRSINLITGPSRTADVEQTIQLGAHGPRRLHVVILTHTHQ